ncbi:hypothetical protein A2U01_0084104, partial [Trifolium medium]|nr:hypothetical protein [Trifolium medium]
RWAKWLVRNFESCSNETEIIMSRCHVIFAIMREDPIQIGEMIARSIKRMITGPIPTLATPSLSPHYAAWSMSPPGRTLMR